MTVAALQIPYNPRWYQYDTHEALKRFNVLVFHRRAGKTVACINELIKQVLQCDKKRPRGAYIAPFLKQAKAIAWDYMLEYTEGIPRKVNKSELSVEFGNGAKIQLLGADNYHALRGMYLDYVVLDEFAQMSPLLWSQVIRPLLTDREGGAIFIGTPQGKNTFYKLYNRAMDPAKVDWYGKLLKVTDTDALKVEEINAARDEMSEEEFEQEFMCSWSAAIKGAYYGRIMKEAHEQGRITTVPYNDEFPVYTAWDLGIADLTVVWFVQFIGHEPRVINCKSFQNTGLPEIKCELLKLNYKEYAEHIGPHDIKVREIGTGASRLETARNMGLIFSVCRNIPVIDGINATRQLLKTACFDARNCETGIEALSQYRSEYNEIRDVYSTKPLHDWTSHYADAFRMLAVHRANKPMKQQALDYSYIDRAAI